MDCIFCKIVAGQIPCTKVYEDAETMAFLDIHPINPGHTLVVPKVHVENFSQADAVTMMAVFATAQKVAKAAMAATGAPGYNIGVNTGVEAGQVVMHWHVHVMPRFAGDGHEHWGKKEMTMEAMNEVGEGMKTLLV